MARGIDHLVLAVRDLDAARAAYAAARLHADPGSAGIRSARRIRLPSLTGRSSSCWPSPIRRRSRSRRRTFFSFAAFNRDFLEGRRGPLHARAEERGRGGRPRRLRGAVVCRSTSRSASSGSREAPDGAERKVAFSLDLHQRAAAAGAPASSPASITSRRISGGAEFQRHANGARRIASAVMVTRDPADFHEFLTHFTGQHDIKSTSLGVAFDLGDGSRVEVLSPVAFRAFFGERSRSSPTRARFMAWRVAVADLGDGARVLRSERRRRSSERLARCAGRLRPRRVRQRCSAFRRLLAVSLSAMSRYSPAP